MKISQIPVPAVYREESADFRFFQKWFELALTKIQYDTEEFFNLYDPLRCPAELLWMLGESMGYRYDDRMTTAFNRLVMIYFMSIIRLKGSKDGVTLAAQLNLDQFHLQYQAETNSILNNRLEDTSIPSNSVYVQPYPEKGYIDVVYFSDRIPVDSCLEYARPVGMYLVPHAGVRYDVHSKLNIDSRLTNTEDLNVSIGSTHIGHYSQDDYSRLQRVVPSDFKNTKQPVTKDTLSDKRNPVWYRNSQSESSTSSSINPGYRALYTLQLSNGESVTKSLLKNSPLVASSIRESDVNIVDPDGRVHTFDEFAEQNSRIDPTEYVEPTVMGAMGDAMTAFSEIPSNSDNT